MSTVDWLLTASLNPKSPYDQVESIQFTWRMTDSVIESVKEKAHSKWVQGLSNLLSLIEAKLADIRMTRVYVGVNPLNVIQFYLNLSEVIERKCFLLDALSMNGLVRRHFPLPSTAYALFIKGMSKRFAELSHGTVYVR